MALTIKYLRAVRYRTQDEQVRTAIVLRKARKYIHMVWIEDSGITIHRVPLAEERFMRPMGQGIAEAALSMLASGERLGITKRAEWELLELATAP